MYVHGSPMEYINKIFFCKSIRSEAEFKEVFKIKTSAQLKPVFGGFKTQLNSLNLHCFPIFE